MDFLNKLAEGANQAYQGAKAAIQGPAQQAVDSTGLSDVNIPGTAPPAPGETTTGGKMGGRRRRTRRSKKSKKTLRRRK